MSASPETGLDLFFTDLAEGKRRMLCRLPAGAGILCCCFLAGMLPCAGARAHTPQEPGPTPAKQGISELPPIAVETPALEQNPASIASVAPPADLRPILQSLPGVVLRGSGGLGAYTEATLRGGSGRQGRIFLNGMPLLTAGGEALNLSLLPAGAITAAETDFARNAGLSGDLRLYSRSHIRRAGFTLGRFGEQQIFAGGPLVATPSPSSPASKDPALWFLQARQADNDFPIRNPLKPFDPTDPLRLREEPRHNARTQNISLLRATPASILLAAWNTEQIPDRRNTATQDADLEVRLLQWSSMATELGQIRLGLLEEHYRDPNATISLVATNVRNRTAATGLSFGGQRWDLDTELSAFQTRDSSRPHADLDVQRFQLSAIYEPLRTDDTMSLGWRAGLGATGERREDGQSKTTAALSPTLDVWRRFSAAPGNAVVRLQYRERIPTFFERYGSRGLFQGNPALKPEEAATLSLRLQSKRSFAPVVDVFTRWLWDGITPQYNARGVGRSTNAAQARVSGVSLLATSATHATLQWHARVDWQHSEDRSGGTVEGKRLPGRPTWVTDLGVRHAFNSTEMGAPRLTLEYRFHFESDAYYDTPNLLRAPIVREHALTLHARMGRQFSAFISGENLSDNRHARFNSFPEPGQRFRLGLEFHFTTQEGLS